MSEFIVNPGVVEGPLTLSDRIHQMWARQAADWPMLARNIEALQTARVKPLVVGPLTVVAQCNWARFSSSSSASDPKEIAARPCFLCEVNRPPEQESLPFGEDWLLLCNPAPILAPHFTIVSRTHQPQLFRPAMAALVDLARELGEAHTVFYNGPRSGASAPDHLHMQAIPARILPVEKALAAALAGGGGDVPWLEEISGGDGRVLATCGKWPAFIVISSDSREYLLTELERIQAVLPPDVPEPRFNFFAAWRAGRWMAWFAVRAEHRPRCYGTSDEQFLISPGSIDIGGVIVLPRERDFERINAEVIQVVHNDVLVSAENFHRIKTALANGC